MHVPLPTVTGLLDTIAAEDPNPALLQVERLASVRVSDGDTRYTLLRLEIDSVVVTDAAGAESVGVATLLTARPGPFCAVEACWLQHLDCAAAGSAPWGSTATACGCAWRARTATATSGCRFASRSTTRPV